MSASNNALAVDFERARCKNRAKYEQNRPRPFKATEARRSAEAIFKRKREQNRKFIEKYSPNIDFLLNRMYHRKAMKISNRRRIFSPKTSFSVTNGRQIWR